MKRLIYLSLFLSLVLYSCESIPEAHFYTDTIEPVVGQEVFFTNDSHNANMFEWDFGDGYISEAENPSHIFTATGTFEVTLIAISKSGLEDKATITIDVVIPTLLEIEVREYFDEYVVADASVILYPSIVSWDAQTDKVSEGFTDDDGIVVFSGLDPFGYYVDVWEQNHDNYALRDEDYMQYIRTPDVIPNKINRFVAWVDYVEHGKGIGRGERSLVIKKFERKAGGKYQPEADGGTEGWQELYNRRVNK